MEKTYLSCAETAKLIRQALKESFPGVKFSVRSSVYAGGASVRVGWTDGPTDRQVSRVAKCFQGSYFDGMIDYKGSNYHRLDGQLVHMGADFVFTNRKLTKARAEQLAGHFAGKWGRDDWLEVSGCDYFGYHVGRTRQAPYLGDELDEYDEATSGVTVQSSATLARIESAGDDGYGQGTTGSDYNGWQGDQCGKAVSAAQAARAIFEG